MKRERQQAAVQWFIYNVEIYIYFNIFAGLQSICVSELDRKEKNIIESKKKIPLIS